MGARRNKGDIIIWPKSKCYTRIWSEYKHFMYWIYLLPSTQQTIGCNVFFYNDMFQLTRVIVRLCSEPFGFSTIVTYSSGGCWSVWSGGYPYTDMNEILIHISRNVGSCSPPLQGKVTPEQIMHPSYRPATSRTGNYKRQSQKIQWHLPASTKTSIPVFRCGKYLT
jgi:hypothetical protein